jgi:hypothetical protein
VAEIEARHLTNQTTIYLMTKKLTLIKKIRTQNDLVIEQDLTIKRIKERSRPIVVHLLHLNLKPTPVLIRTPTKILMPIKGMEDLVKAIVAECARTAVLIAAIPIGTRTISTTLDLPPS